MTTIVAEKKAQRIIYHCKNCQHTYAYDYMKMGMDTKTGKPFLVRKGEGKKAIWSHEDKKCPSCSEKKRVTVAPVLASLSSHICDARCLNATGTDCTCSCGGVNHGAKFLC